MELVSAASDFIVAQCQCQRIIPSITTHQKKPQLFCQKLVASSPYLTFSSSISRTRISHKVKLSSHSNPTPLRENMQKSYEAGNYDKSLFLLERLVGDGSGTYKPNVYFCTKLIKGFVDSKRIEKAVQVLEILESYGEPNVYPYTCIISGYSKLNQIGSAMPVFDRMRKRGLVPTVMCYNSMLNLFLKNGKRNEADELLKDMSLRNCEPSEATFSILMHSFCRDEKIGSAMQFFNRMRNQGFVPNVIDYSSLLNLLLKNGKSNEAEELLKDMSLTNCEPDRATFSILMRSFCRDEKIGSAMQVFTRMRSRGFVPNVVGYNSLLNLLLKNGKINDAEELLKDMSLTNCEPDQATFSILMHSFCRDENMDKAMNVLMLAMEKGVKPDVYLMTPLISGWCNKRRLDMAVECIDHMILHGCLPSPKTYCHVLSLLWKNGSVKLAVYLFEKLRGAGCHLNVVSYNIMIKGLWLKSRDMIKAIRLVAEMIDRGIGLDNLTYTKLISCLCRDDFVDQAIALLGVMESNVIIPCVTDYNIVLSGLIKAHRLDDAIELLEEMVLENGCQPDYITYRTLLIGISLAGMKQEAAELADSLFQMDLLETKSFAQYLYKTKE